MNTDVNQQDLTYRHYIEREFRSRCRRNPSYSLRAYARDLDVPPSKLSEVLRKCCGLSAQSASAIIPKLKLSDQESEFFILSVEAEHSRSIVRKQQARNHLQQFHIMTGFTDLDLEKFKIISDWYHNALLELMNLHHFESNTEWMADQLGLDLETTVAALNRLEKFNLISRDSKKWTVCHDNTVVDGKTPSREIREYHSQVLEKAVASIEDQSMSERDISSVTLAIDESDFPKVQKKIQEFRRGLAHELASSTSKNRIYNLSVQFFPLSKKKELQ